MRILVADDSVVSARVLRGLLESLGHSVELVVNGRDAVASCLGGTFDAVLMDVRMPEVDGCEATRQIRRGQPPERRTPIIALTAADTQEERARCLEAGMDDCLAKPVGAPQLAVALGRWTGTRSERPSRARRMPGEDASGAIDGRVLDELRSYLGSIAVAERIEDYIDHLGERLRGLREALERRDRDALHRLVHGLKGTSGFVGAHRLAALCRQAEATGPGGPRAEDPEMIAALEQEGDEVIAGLREWQERAQSTRS